MSFIPVLERTFLWLAILKDRPTTNPLFFADAARLSSDDYLAKIAAGYNDQVRAGGYAADMSDQIVRISRIAVRKFWMFNLAAMPLLICLIAAAVLMACSKF
jgi:hypothetical protein